MKKSSENIAGFFYWITQPNLLSINYIYSFGLCISVKLKNLKANHNEPCLLNVNASLCISVKLKNLKANHNSASICVMDFALCISVKLKNLKANHNIRERAPQK